MKLQILLCLVFACSVCLDAAPELSLPTLFLPDVDGFCAVVKKIINKWNKDPPNLSFEDKHINIPVNEDIYLNFDISKISFYGMELVQLVECTPSDVGISSQQTFCSVFLEKFNIYLTNYTLNGSAGHLPLVGNGDGSIKMENFTISLTGVYPKDTLRNLRFDSLTLDFFLYQWTVYLDNLMPGNDIGTVANEALSEVGRESMNAIEDAINKNLTEVVNFVLDNLKSEDDLYTILFGDN